jgi:TRAP-type C4-dicarboxylate transport system substrate-binding protein
MKLVKPIAVLGAATLALAATAASAADMTLRVHQMLPEQATIPARAIEPWAQRIEEQSGGRIDVQLFPSMQLGGAPPELYDQAASGVVDVIWTVIGYTPGRFPTSETFELPFIMALSAEDNSRAFHEFMVENASREFSDTHVLAFHTHGPGLIHSRNPITSLEDFQNLKIRGGSRVINLMLEKLGAEPVGMPVPAVPEGLSSGVIDATTIPWEVTPALHVAELVHNHTGFSGDHGWYTQTFVFAMNKDTYNNLPDDLKAVIDANSGPDLAAEFGRAMDEGDQIGLKIAQDLGNNIITLDEAETDRWKAVAQEVIADWIGEMNDRGLDGQALFDRAKELIAQYSM